MRTEWVSKDKRKMNIQKKTNKNEAKFYRRKGLVDQRRFIKSYELVQSI